MKIMPTRGSQHVQANPKVQRSWYWAIRWWAPIKSQLAKINCQQLGQLNELIGNSFIFMPLELNLLHLLPLTFPVDPMWAPIFSSTQSTLCDRWPLSSTARSPAFGTLAFAQAGDGVVRNPSKIRAPKLSKTKATHDQPLCTDKPWASASLTNSLCGHEHAGWKHA